MLKRTPFTREARVAPPFFRVSELNAKAKAWKTMKILSIGEGRNPVETKAMVPIKTAIIKVFVLIMC